MKRYRGSLSQANHASNEPNVWLDAFLDKLASPYVPTLDCFPSFPSPPSSYRMDEPFCFSELSSVVANLNDSSPGVGGIPYLFVKNCTDLSKRFLLSFFNIIYECAFFSASTVRRNALVAVTGQAVKWVTKTRWSARHVAVKMLKNKFEVILGVLEQLTDSSQTSKTRSRVSFLLTAMQSFNFLTFLGFWAAVLPEVDEAQIYLQQQGLLRFENPLCGK